jgi:hypothetical protein
MYVHSARANYNAGKEARRSSRTRASGHSTCGGVKDIVPSASPRRWLAALAAVSVHAALLASIWWVSLGPHVWNSPEVSEGGPEGEGHLFDLLSAPDATRVLLASPNPRGHGRGLGWWSPSHGIWLAGDELSPLPVDRTYQLWLTPSGRRPINLGTLHVDRDGSGRMLSVGHWVRDTPRDAELVLTVTEEPRGGSTRPSADVHLIGPLPRAR